MPRVTVDTVRRACHFRNLPSSHRGGRNAVSRVERLAAMLGMTWLLGFAIRQTLRRRPQRGTPDLAPAPKEAAARADPSDGDALAGDSGLYERIPAWERGERDQSSGWERLKRWLLGRERIPIPSYIGLIEDPPPRGAPAKTGICCSGGGIRSAAFNLGALQELQAAKRLQQSKYVAAVSGGSYIAAAFSMVAKTAKPNTDDSDDSDPGLFTAKRPPLYHGSPEEQYLRNRSSYLAPGGTGRVRFVLRVALGLLVNLAFLVSGLVLVAWVLATYYRHVHGPLQVRDGHVGAGTRHLEWVIAGALAGIALLLGFVSVFLRARTDRARRALETLTIYGLGLAAIIVVVAVALPDLVAFLRNHGFLQDPHDVNSDTAKGGVATAASGSFGALLVAVLLELRSKLSVERATKAAAWYAKLAAPLRRAVARVATWLVGPLLVGSALVFLLLAMVTARHISALAVVGVALLFAVFWLFSDVTAWSLHPFYRRRLCTAFALKRVRRETSDEFGMAVERDYRKLVPLSESGIEPGPGPFKAWPTLVVCAAANVSDAAATPPGRRVTSFTFSPVALGGPLVGGIPTAAFEERIAASRRRDFTLAAAVAMSGAAVSPSMGKETRRSVRFLLGLANVRLGVWVPNPRRTELWLESSKGMRTRLDRFRDIERGRVKERLIPAGDDASRASDQFRKWLLIPRAGPWYLLKEMCGWNSVNDPYLYVTDGGHYENLGLVELLRRGCTEVFCFDASGGKSLDALGDAIALARSELNVEIDELDPAPLKEDDDRLAARCCVSGRITYPGGRKGVLIYARTVVTAEAPYDVQAFRIRDEAFPHHSTLDQLYTDEKFEAYRELGAHTGRAALAEAAKADDALFGSTVAAAPTSA
jgi:hypothetical protein